jgi:uncharacterized protein (TIGR02001 family)
MLRGVFTGTALAFSIVSADAADLTASVKDTSSAPDALTVTGYTQGVTDYVFRGISQNRRDPTVQGGLDAVYGIFYVGSFASGVNFASTQALDLARRPFDPQANLEWDMYGGIKPKWGDLTFDFGVIAYIYPGERVQHPLGYFQQTYVEFKAGVSATVLKDLALSATVFISPDYNGEAGMTAVVEGTASKPLFSLHGVDVAASGTAGHLSYERSTAQSPFTIALHDYTYWNLGATATWDKHYSLDLRWWDTAGIDTGKAPCGSDISALQCRSAFAATVKYSF